MNQDGRSFESAHAIYIHIFQNNKGKGVSEKANITYNINNNKKLKRIFTKE